MKNKIPCIVLVYYNFDIIKKSIEFLAEDNRLEIYVIENKSEFTSKIKPFLLEKVEKRIIKKYALFDKNISNNAYELFFDNCKIEEEHEFILITDGDIIVQKNQYEKDWLEEEISIIKENADIQCCGININFVNLPRNNKFFTSENENPIYNCENWIPDKFGKIYEKYVEADTGVHLLLFRRELFNDFIKKRAKNHWRFLDETLRTFVKNDNDLRWVVTKYNYSYHLTWDIYNDPEHSYTKMKMTPDFYKFWKHFDYCYFTLYEKNKKTRVYPVKSIKALIKKVFLFKRLSKL